jgi:hypothetical protein
MYVSQPVRVRGSLVSDGNPKYLIYITQYGAQI